MQTVILNKNQGETNYKVEDEFFLEYALNCENLVTYNPDLTYDSNGNLIKGLGKYYEYDSFNQLTEIRNSTTGILISKFSYDHEGNRIKQIEYNLANNGHNRTTYYISDNFIQIRYTNGTILNETYYYANGKLIAKKDNSGAKTFYHGDHLGSTTLVTNQSGNIVEEEFYLPHGDVYSGGESSRFLFTSKELDKLTDLYYYGARYYQASIMRLFTQCDSVKPDIYDPQQLNCYNYARNNPYRYNDPTGHVVEDVFFIGWDLYDIYNEGFTGSNILALTGDVAGLAVPFVGGIGRATKTGAKALNKVSDVADVVKAGEKVGEASKFKQYENSLKETGEATVKSFGEANKLRESLFSGLQKVPGAGPSMTKSSGSAFKGTNVYKTDYLFDKETGKIYGHGSTSLHGDKPHINIKEGKNKFTIIIDKIKEKFKNEKK